jgi:hypothetical protein
LSAQPKPQQYTEKQLRDVKALKGDPFMFAATSLGVKYFTPDQRRLIGTIAEQKYTACTSGNVTGKSFALACVALWFGATRLNSRVITTSASWELVENVLWREIRDLYANAPGGGIGGRLLNTSLEFGDKWLIFGLSTDNVTRAQGKHAEGGVMVIADEATGIPPTIWAGLDSMVVGPEDKFVAVGNPTDPTSQFFIEWEKPGKWAHVVISCENHPNVLEGRIVVKGAVTREKVQEMLAQYGRSHPEYEARVLGIWPRSQGWMFRQDFDPTPGGRHVFEPSKTEIPAWWPHWIAVDWGFAHNTAALFAAFDGSTTYVYDEFVANEKTPAELGAMIGQRANPQAPEGRPSVIHTVYLAHDAFSRIDAVRTRADQMGDALAVWGLPFPTMASRDRVGGWNLITTMLRAGTLKVSTACPRLIQKIQTLKRDPSKPEDAFKEEGDDEMDALYKLLASRPIEPFMPYEVRVAQRMERFKTEHAKTIDPQSLAMAARLAASEERGDVPYASGRRHLRGGF